MIEQDGMQESKSNNKQIHVLQRPANDDQEAWKIYWQAQGQLWRTEPEICAERQDYLTERLKCVPDIEQGVYAFKGEKLNRADIEWLLATHENGRGPIDWSDEPTCVVCRWHSCVLVSPGIRGIFILLSNWIRQGFAWKGPICVKPGLREPLSEERTWNMPTSVGLFWKKLISVEHISGEPTSERLISREANS
jgi:hypothetical protein